MIPGLCEQILAGGELLIGSDRALLEQRNEYTGEMKQCLPKLHAISREHRNFCMGLHGIIASTINSVLSILLYLKADRTIN